MINKQPAIFNIEQLEVGYSKIRVIHNTPSDIDIASRSVWVKAAGANQSTANRVDTAYISKDHLYVDTLTAGTSYDFSFSLVDAFVSTSSVLLNAQYTGVESVLSITEQNAVSMKTPCTITSVINVNNDQEQIGSPASTVQITFAGTAATSLVEASTDNFSTSEVIYTGAISDNIIAITLSANTYKFRVTSYFTFSDGVVDTGSTNTFSTQVSVSDNISAPAAVTGLTASAVKILDNIASHNLKLDWSWALGSTGQKQNTLVQYIEYDGTSAVNWTNAVSEISLGTDHTFNSVPYRKHLKVRVQVQGWNNNSSAFLYAEVFISEDTADSTKTGYILAVDGESLSANTKVYIDSRYIQGFDTSADKTFEFDAATGNVTIGKAGTYNGTSVAVPFQFDAVNSILNISGQVITDEIVAADFVMGWLGGSPPSFRTSNRSATTGYSESTEGLWMGYTDASTFKFSMGDGTQYIKWNGSQLSISGSVTIGDPTGPTLGQQQKSVMYYKAGTTAPNTPTGGTFASPTPTESGWTTSIPTLATGPDNAYLSQRTFTSDAAAPQDSSWTAPGLFTAGGARGAGNYSKTNASWTSDSNFTTTNVNSALPDGVPVIGDIVILSNTDSATWNRTARYVGGTVSPSPLAAGGWERFTLVINGNALVTGTVIADNFEAISYAADNTTVESTVKLNKGNDLIFAAASVWNPDDGSDPTVKSLETIFQITKDGDGIIDGKAVSVRSIFPSSFSEQAVDYIQNAIGATVNSGGLKSYNGPSGTLTNNSIIQKNLNPLTHVNGNPTTISGEGLVSFSNDYSYSTPVAANITMTLNRRLSSQTQSQTVQIATTGSVAVTTSSVLQQGAQGEPSEWTHSYYWNETLTPTAEDLTSGDYVYDIRISCSNTSVIDSVGLTFSVEEQVVTAGVDLSDYATEAEVDTKLLDYVLDTDSRLTNARTATLTGNLLTAVPVNALFTDTNTTYSVGDGGLTEKDFTATLKTKLDGIATSANNYVLPNSFIVSGSISAASVGATSMAAGTFREGGTLLSSKYQAIGSYVNNSDTRLSNARTPSLTGNLLTAVPVNALFTDTNTTYSVGDGGLTEKDFTATLKTKLDGIATNANNYVLPSSISVTGSIEGTTLTENGVNLVSKYQAIGSYVNNSDSRLSNARTPSLTGNLLTAVPINALFTDTNTTYSVGDGGLTEKDFTATLKTKLDGIATSANNYVLPSSISVTGSIEGTTLTENGDDLVNKYQAIGSYVNNSDTRLSNARTATLTGNLLTAVPANALFTDTNTWRAITNLVNSTSQSTSASALAVKTAYDKANAALPKTGGTMTGSIGLSQNPVGTTYGDGVAASPSDMISQLVGDNDGWRLYGESPATNDVKVIFEVTDDLETGDTWVFRNKKTYSPYTATEPFKINGNGNITALGTVTATGGNSGNWNTSYGWGNHASAGYLSAVSVNAPSITSTSVVDETIEIVIGASTFSGVDHYEVWSDGATGSDYSLIARIAEEDIASSMSVIDTSFEIAGTIAYRVYAISNGTYSTAATDTQVFVMPTLDVLNLSIIPDLNVYHIEYNIPDTRFIDHIEIYVDKHAVLGSLSRSNAVLSYSGNNKQHTYSISNLNLESFHQFWVEIVST